MKISKKIAANLARRQAEFTGKMPSGQQTHRPGSQNRKKGYGMSRGSR